MEKNKKILILIDEGKTSGIKIDRELFFRHEDEEELDFYNERVIPILNKKGIDFSKCFVPLNVIFMEEENFQIENDDNINITEKQMDKILNSQSMQELYYDESLYVIRLYEYYNDQKYNSDEDWENIINPVSIVRNSGINELKKNKIILDYINKPESNGIEQNSLIKK